MSNTQEYEASNIQYEVKYRDGNGQRLIHHRRHDSARRRRKAPQSFNGIHRRRRKKFSW